MTRKITIAAAIVANCFLATAAQADSDGMVDDATKAKITQTLEGQGYTVGKIKMEDGNYEAYARKDGKKMEVYLDKDMNIVKTDEKD